MTVMPLSMRRNCNLELRLLPSSASLPIDSGNNHHHPMMDESNTTSPQQQQQQQQQQHQQQQMTIFYNGKVCVCDATELQARAIIMLARREMEEKLTKIPSPGSGTPSSPLLQYSQALYSPTTIGGGLSMKRSLQRFLQKRNNRIQATSPYHR